MKFALTVFVLGFLTFSSALKAALAANANGPFGVSATVQATCLASASSVRFRTYRSAAVSATTNVSMNCTDATPYDISLGAERASGTIAVSSKMTALGLVLHGYLLASNTEENVNPVHGAETDTVAGTGNGASQNITVRGPIPAWHSVAEGVYPDVITVTVTY